MELTSLAPILWAAIAMYLVLPILQAILLHRQGRAKRAWLFLVVGYVIPFFVYWSAMVLGFSAGGWAALLASGVAFLSPLAIFLLALRKPNA